VDVESENKDEKVMKGCSVIRTPHKCNEKDSIPSAKTRHEQQSINERGVQNHDIDNHTTKSANSIVLMHKN
jgi:hypothetical protein